MAAGPPRKFDRAEAAALADRGLNGRQIAEALGVTPDAVRQAFRAMGRPLPGPRNGHGVASDQITPGVSRFGRLLVIEDTGHRDHNAVVWRCLCDPAAGGCGNVHHATSAALIAGKAASCGCLRSELAAVHCRLLGRAVQARHRGKQPRRTPAPARESGVSPAREERRR